MYTIPYVAGTCPIRIACDNPNKSDTNGIKNKLAYLEVLNERGSLSHEKITDVKCGVMIPTDEGFTNWLRNIQEEGMWNTLI